MINNNFKNNYNKRKVLPPLPRQWPRQGRANLS